MPRSASRDHSDRYEGNRAYFHAPDWLRRAKTWALVASVALVVCWSVVDILHPQASSYHTHGALANPHAAWDSNCEACHKAHGISEFGLASIFKTQERWHDLTCTKCHAGPTHHDSLTTEGQAFHDRCSNCHHDHAGRTASLTRISDEHCVRCHEDLAKNHKDGKPSFQNVTAFATAKGHPEFTAIREFGPSGEAPARPYERRRLKFNHALHMTPGIVLEPGSADRSWTPEKLGRLHVGSDRDFVDAAKDRYKRGGKATDPIQLACADCHQLDAGHSDLAVLPDDPSRRTFEELAMARAGEPRQSVLPPRAAGAYYLPVNFAAHCMACHPLRAPDGTAGDAVIPGFPVPHRVQPAELKSLIVGNYRGRLLDQNPLVASLPVPGGRLDKADADAKAAFSTAVDGLTTIAFNAFLLNAALVPPGPDRAKTVKPSPEEFRVPTNDSYGGYACGKCHFTTGPWNDPATARIERLPQHTVWFGHATFNHVSHRGVDCASCHPGTGRPTAPLAQVLETEPLAILGAESCRACHAPLGAKVTLPDKSVVAAAGIRYGCTDCHRYHNGDRPLQGLGAPARDPAHPNSLPDFLRGGKSAP